MIPYNHDTHEPCRSAPHAGQQEMTVNGFTFPADEKLVPLLYALNAAGLQTYSHCAGHTPDAPAWVVLELHNVDIEIRRKDGRHQALIRWISEPSDKEKE